MGTGRGAGRSRRVDRVPPHVEIDERTGPVRDTRPDDFSSVLSASLPVPTSYYVRGGYRRGNADGNGFTYIAAFCAVFLPIFFGPVALWLGVRGVRRDRANAGRALWISVAATVLGTVILFTLPGL